MISCFGVGYDRRRRKRYKFGTVTGSRPQTHTHTRQTPPTSYETSLFTPPQSQTRFHDRDGLRGGRVDEIGCSTEPKLMMCTTRRALTAKQTRTKRRRAKYSGRCVGTRLPERRLCHQMNAKCTSKCVCVCVSVCVCVCTFRWSVHIGIPISNQANSRCR